MTRRLAWVVLFAATLAASDMNAQSGFLDRTVKVNGSPFRYQVFVPATYATSTERLPVIVFLHGAGERGSDALLQTATGLGTAVRRSASKWPAIIIFPQTPSDSTWIGAPAQAAIGALDQTLAEFRTDPDRVYLTGLSLGGNGTWNLAYNHPDRFAAIAPVCAFISRFARLPNSRAIVPDTGAAMFAAVASRIARIPAWVVHGEIDPVVPVEESRRAVAALKAAGADVRYTEIIGGGHDVWDLTYGSPAFRDWLFAQRRSPRR